VELEFGNVGFYEGRKTGEPGEKPSEQGREPTAIGGNRNGHRKENLKRSEAQLIHLLSSHNASVSGTGTPADPSAFITLKNKKTRIKSHLNVKT